MATKDLINLGTAPDTGTGDSARRGGEKINTIFVDHYTNFGDNPIVTDVTDASYGQRESFGSNDYKVGELLPAGKWKTLDATQASLNDTFTLLRGEQVILDMGNTARTFTINLPHANPGDVVRLRDAFGTWSPLRKVQIRTSALVPTSTTWNLKGTATVGHVNINGISYSNTAVTAETSTNGYASDITATSTGYIIDNPFSDVEFVYIGHTSGWRATVTAVNKSETTGTVIFDEPFYNTRNYSNTDTLEQPVFYTQPGTQLALTKTEADLGVDTTVTSTVFGTTLTDDAVSEARRTKCNTIIIDENWILNSSTNGIILNDIKQDESIVPAEVSNQWTIYVALPQSSTTWNDILGQRIVIANNSRLPVVIKPLVFDVTETGNTYSDPEWTTTGVALNTSTDFIGLGGTKAWSLANYSWIDGQTQTTGFGERIKNILGTPTLTDSNANALRETPIGLEKLYDASIKSITLSFTADSNVDAHADTDAGRATPNVGRKIGWRVLNTEDSDNERKQRSFLITDGLTGNTNSADKDREFIKNYITPNQVPTTYLSTVEATTGNDLTNASYEQSTTAGIAAGDSSNGVSYIITNSNEADPFTGTDAQLVYSGLEIYKNGELLVEGRDWKALRAIRNVPTTVTENPSYHDVISHTDANIYAFADTQVTRSADVDTIEFTAALVAGDRIETHWYPVTTVSSSLTSAIQDVVSQNLVQSVAASANLNQIILSFTAEDNIVTRLADGNTASTPIWWRNANVDLFATSGGLNGSADDSVTPWYFSIGNVLTTTPPSTALVHNQGFNPRVVVQEAVDNEDRTPSTPGFNGNGYETKASTVFVDDQGNLFVETHPGATGRFTGRVIIYQ